MKITLVNHEEGFIELMIQGEISEQRLPSDEDPLIALLGQGAYSCKVLLDFSDATFLDSSGIGWLIKSNKQFNQQGGSLVLHSIPPTISQVLRLLKLEQVLSLAEDKSTAKAQASSPSPPQASDNPPRHD